MAEEKTMAEQAQDEWLDLAIENMDKLIPAEWSQQLNEVIFPKLLKIVKMALKKSIKDTHEIVGTNKYLLVCNIPIELPDGKIIQIPHAAKFDKSQLKNEIELNSDPELLVSYLDMYNKIDSYTNIKDIMAAVKDGSLYKGIIKQNSPAPEQKQIEEPKQ